MNQKLKSIIILSLIVTIILSWLAYQFGTDCALRDNERQKIYEKDTIRLKLDRID